MSAVSDLLRYSCPVALASLGETVVELAGVINIGIEGTMLCGCFFGMLGSYLTHSPWIGLGLAVISGTAVSALQSWLCVALAADQVVVGTGVNLAAIGLTSTLFRSRFGQSGTLLSVPKIEPLFGLDPVIWSLFIIAIVLWLLLLKTGWGLAIRACGEYPKAAEASGQSVIRLRTGAHLIGGALAGLGGAYLSLGIAGSFAERMTNGRGFVAIALVTFGRWRPQLVLPAAIAIGYAESLQFSLQGGGLHVPYQLILALPYILALAALVFVGKGARAPESLGLVFKRNS